MHWWTGGEVVVVVVVVGYVWSWRYQTGGRYLLIDLDTENEPTGSVTLTVLLIIIVWSREPFLQSQRECCFLIRLSLINPPAGGAV